MVQINTLDFGSLFAVNYSAFDAFTTVDIFSKEEDIYLAPALTSEEEHTFLVLCMSRRFLPGRVQLVQTDGGPKFKGAFVQAVDGYCDRHRVKCEAIDRIACPYKKNEQSFIESFNRTVRSECLGWSKDKPSDIPDLTQDVTGFLQRYHFHRPHLGLSPLCSLLTSP